MGLLNEPECILGQSVHQYAQSYVQSSFVDIPSVIEKDGDVLFALSDFFR